MKIKFLAAVCAIAATQFGAMAQAPNFSLGADISAASMYDARGVEFLNSEGVPTDLYQLMKDYGINGVRLRVWVNPDKG